MIKQLKCCFFFYIGVFVLGRINNNSYDKSLVLVLKSGLFFI